MRRKRTPIDGPGHYVSSWAVVLWQRGCAMLRDGCDEDGDELTAARLELHHELSLRPWHLSPFDLGAEGEECLPPDDDDPWHLQDWMLVRDIRRRLVAAT